MAKAQRFPVLVATDGSDVGTAAVNGAVAFPWPSSSEGHGVVVRSATKLVDVPDSVFAEIERGWTTTAEAARKILARRWRDAKVGVVDGPIVDAILQRAGRMNARVVVVGSHGHGALMRLLLGSTSLGLVRHWRRATLVVRGQTSFNSIALALDGSPHSKRTVKFVAGLQPPRGGQVTLLSVVEPVVVPSLALIPESAGGLIQFEAGKENTQREKRLRAVCETAAAELRAAGWKVDVKIRKGSPLNELLAGVKAARAQVLAIGARGTSGVERLLLGSVCEGALHRATVSVLVVR